MINDLVERIRDGYDDKRPFPFPQTGGMSVQPRYAIWDSELRSLVEEIERLRAALRWQEDRDAKGNGSTHAGDCYTWGPRHYECALAKIEALEAENKRLREALAQVMAHHDEDIGMDDHDDNDHVGWYGNGEKMSLTFGVLRRARAALEGT